MTLTMAVVVMNNVENPLEQLVVVAVEVEENQPKPTKTKKATKPRQAAVKPVQQPTVYIPPELEAPVVALAESLMADQARSTNNGGSLYTTARPSNALPATHQSLVAFPGQGIDDIWAPITTGAGRTPLLTQRPLRDHLNGAPQTFAYASGIFGALGSTGIPTNATTFVPRAVATSFAGTNSAWLMASTQRVQSAITEDLFFGLGFTPSFDEVSTKFTAKPMSKFAGLRSKLTIQSQATLLASLDAL